MNIEIMSQNTNCCMKLRTNYCLARKFTDPFGQAAFNPYLKQLLDKITQFFLLFSPDGEIGLLVSEIRNSPRIIIIIIINQCNLYITDPLVEVR